MKSIMRSMQRPFRTAFRHVALCPAFIILLLILAAQPAVSPDVRAQAPEAAAQAGLQQVQQMLASEGFDPGPADGLMGRQTVRALIAFQRQQGLPQTGRADPAVIERLRQITSARTASNTAAAAVASTQGSATALRGSANIPSANAVPAQSGAGAAALLTGSRWVMIDRSGSRQIIRLLPSGEIADAPMPNFWKWRRNGDILTIEFDNGAGGWVTRTGRLTTPDRIEGRAESSHGLTWTWTGHRQKNRP